MCQLGCYEQLNSVHNGVNLHCNNYIYDLDYVVTGFETVFDGNIV